MNDVEFETFQDLTAATQRIATALEMIAKIQRRTFQAQKDGICNQHESGDCGACDYCEPI